MKRLLTIAMLSLLVVSVAFAGWSHDKVLMDWSMGDSTLVGGVGGMSGVLARRKQKRAFRARQKRLKMASEKREGRR